MGTSAGCVGGRRLRLRLPLWLLALATAATCAVGALTPAAREEAATAAGGAAARSHPADPPPVADAYNETLAHTLVQLCGCTYCCLQGCEDWTCRACQRFPGMDKVVEVHAWRHDAHGFVGHDRDNASNPIVAAFTGTDPFSLPDWVDDLDFVKTAYPSPPFTCPPGPGGGCRVHRGFLEAYLQIREQVLDGLRTLRQAYPEAPILLTGHSLGGVFATFAAMDVLHELNETVQALYTLGKPRCGNRAWQEFVDASLTQAGTAHWRITHARDPVVHLPPRSLGFLHEGGKEVFYPNFLAEDGAYVVCNQTHDGREDRGCSEKHLVDVNIVDHVTYLGYPFTLNYLSCAIPKPGDRGASQS